MLPKNFDRAENSASVGASSHRFEPIDPIFAGALDPERGRKISRKNSFDHVTAKIDSRRPSRSRSRDHRGNYTKYPDQEDPLDQRPRSDSSDRAGWNAAGLSHNYDDQRDVEPSGRGRLSADNEDGKGGHVRKRSLSRKASYEHVNRKVDDRWDQLPEWKKEEIRYRQGSGESTRDGDQTRGSGGRDSRGSRGSRGGSGDRGSGSGHRGKNLYNDELSDSGSWNTALDEALEERHKQRNKKKTKKKSSVITYKVDDRWDETPTPRHHGRDRSSSVGSNGRGNSYDNYVDDNRRRSSFKDELSDSGGWNSRLDEAIDKRNRKKAKDSIKNAHYKIDDRWDHPPNQRDRSQSRERGSHGSDDERGREQRRYSSDEGGEGNLDSGHNNSNSRKPSYEHVHYKVDDRWDNKRPQTPPESVYSSPERRTPSPPPIKRGPPYNYITYKVDDRSRSPSRERFQSRSRSFSRPRGQSQTPPKKGAAGKKKSTVAPAAASRHASRSRIPRSKKQSYDHVTTKVDTGSRSNSRDPPRNRNRSRTTTLHSRDDDNWAHAKPTGRQNYLEPVLNRAGAGAAQTNTRKGSYADSTQTSRNRSISKSPSRKNSNQNTRSRSLSKGRTSNKENQRGRSQSYGPPKKEVTARTKKFTQPRPPWNSNSKFDRDPPRYRSKSQDYSREAFAAGSARKPSKNFYGAEHPLKKAAAAQPYQPLRRLDRGRKVSNQGAGAISSNKFPILVQDNNRKAKGVGGARGRIAVYVKDRAEKAETRGGARDPIKLPDFGFCQESGFRK